MATPRKPGPSDPKRHVHRVKLTDYKAEKADEGAIEIEADDGTVFRVDAPEVWDDSISELASAGNDVEVARALLGEQYDAYRAAGGTALLLMSLIGDVHGVSVGESSPSPSS